MENIARLEEVLVGEAARRISNLMIGAANIPKESREIVYQQLLDDLTRTLNSTRANTIRISEDLDSLDTNMETLQKKEFLHDYLPAKRWVDCQRKIT